MTIKELNCRLPKLSDGGSHLHWTPPLMPLSAEALKPEKAK